MNIPPISKTKEAFRAFFAALLAGTVHDTTTDSDTLPAVTALTGYNFYRGIRSGLQQLPSICISALGFEPEDPEAEDQPVWRATIVVFFDTRVVFVAGAAEASEDAHDATVEAVLGAFTSDDFQSFCNSENTVNRPTALASGFHTSRLLPPKVMSKLDKEHSLHTHALTFEVMVQNDDGDE